ncbi:MAG: hypothetical protein U1E56_13930 [Bauldia sp.]
MLARRSAGFSKNHSALRRPLLFGAAVGLAVAGAAAAAAYVTGRPLGPRLGAIAATLGFAAAVAAAAAWPLATAMAGKRPPTARFAAMAILIALGTLVLGGLAFVASRIPFVDFGDSALFSRSFLSSLFWSSASSLYLYSGTGPRLLLPFAPLVLIAAAAIFARRRRQQ